LPLLVLPPSMAPNAATGAATATRAAAAAIFLPRFLLPNVI